MAARLIIHSSLFRRPSKYTAVPVYQLHTTKSAFIWALHLSMPFFLQLVYIIPVWKEQYWCCWIHMLFLHAPQITVPIWGTRFLLSVLNLAHMSIKHQVHFVERSVQSLCQNHPEVLRYTEWTVLDSWINFWSQRVPCIINKLPNLLSTNNRCSNTFHRFSFNPPRKLQKYFLSSTVCIYRVTTVERMLSTRGASAAA